MYVRANTLIPTIEPQMHMSEDPFENVTFDAYVLESGAFDLEDTDGVTHVAVAFMDKHVEVKYSSPKSQLSLRLLPLVGQPTMDHVSVNGQNVPFIREQNGSMHIVLSR